MGPSHGQYEGIIGIVFECSIQTECGSRKVQVCTVHSRGVKILSRSIFWSKGVDDKKIGVNSSSYKFMIMVISKYFPCSSRMY